MVGADSKGLFLRCVSELKLIKKLLCFSLSKYVPDLLGFSPDPQHLEIFDSVAGGRTGIVCNCRNQIHINTKTIQGSRSKSHSLIAAGFSDLLTSPIDGSH